MTENGTQAHGRKVVRLPLNCGLIGHIETLPFFVLKGIRRKAEQLYPYPDEKSYRLPFPDSAIDDDYKPATENPTYVRLIEKIDVQRDEYITWATVRLCLSFSEGKDQLIADYAERRSQVALLVDDLPDDEWDATLYCLVSTGGEVQTVYRIATDQEPLTQEEVHDGVRFFRRDVPEPAHRRVVRETPGVPRGAAEQS